LHVPRHPPSPRIGWLLNHPGSADLDGPELAVVDQLRDRWLRDAHKHTATEIGAKLPPLKTG
jgi:hypothetical protein